MNKNSTTDLGFKPFFNLLDLIEANASKERVRNFLKNI